MRTATALFVISACFGQGVENRSVRGTRDDSGLKWIPPAATFATPPTSPPAGAVYIFTDALSLGTCAGGGVARATCQWTGNGWVPTAGGGNAMTTNNTVVLLGDSITALNTPTYYASGSDWSLGANGYWNWANAMLGGGFTVVNYAGVSGNTTAQMLARIQTDVTAYHPGWCVVLGGVNDITTGVASATTIINLTAIYNALNAAGIKTVLVAVTPYSGMGNTNAAWYAINSWMKSFVQTSPNVYLVDAAAAIIDSTNLTIGPLPNTTGDGKHFISLGAFLVGKAIAATLAGAVPPAQAIIWNSDPSTLVTNGMQIGTGGIAGSGASGSVSNSWTLTAVNGASCVGSKSTRADGMGAVQTITMTGSSASSYCQFSQTISGWGASDVLQIQAEIMSGSTIGRMIAPQIVYHGGSDHIVSALYQDDTTILTQATPYMLIKSSAQNFWGGTTSVEVGVWIYGTSSTVNIGRVQVQKL